MHDDDDVDDEAPLPPPTPPPALTLLRSAANDFGVKYEMKMAALLVLRARRLHWSASLYRNVEAALPLDDLVLRVEAGDATHQFLVQLKHGSSADAAVDIQAFCAKKKENKGEEKSLEKNDTERGDFNLRKYFAFFKRFHDMYEERRRDETAASADQRFLSDVPLERVWYVIHTNKVVKGLSGLASNEAVPERLIEATKEKLGSENWKMMDELFTTNPRRKFFTFNETQEKVWDLLKHKEGEILYQEKFLPKLLIFSGQAHVENLDDLIMKEIHQLCGNAKSSKQPSSNDHHNRILDHFLQEVESWVKDKAPWTVKKEMVTTKDGSSQKQQQKQVKMVKMGLPLRTDAALLEKAAAVELRRRAREASLSLSSAAGEVPLLRFSDASCDALARALRARPRPHLRVHVPGLPPGLRAAKLIQVLDKDADYRENWLYINETILHITSPSIIKYLSRSSRIVVLDLPKRFLEHELFLPDSLEGDAQLVTLCESPGDSHLEDVWTLDQLSADAQERLLHGRVLFQGEEMPLSSLRSEWPALGRSLRGAALRDLALGRTLTLGDPLPPITPSGLYVPRVLKHLAVLDDKVLEISSEGDFFVLKGFPEEILKRLRGGGWWQECLPSGKPVYTDHKVRRVTFMDILEETGNRDRAPFKTKWIAWHEEIDINNNMNENVHWLSFNNGFITWDGSDGDTEILRKYVKRLSPQCEISPVCIHKEEDFVSWDADCVFLPDIAGMGKTTFLKHVARKLKEFHKTHWIVFLSMSDIKSIDDLPQEVQWSDVFDLLRANAAAAAAAAATMERDFLKYSVEVKGNVAVLVDAVDEVCPALKAKALRTLRLLRTALRGKLWVAARTVLEGDLRRALGGEAWCVRLQPFRRDDQALYLTRRWAHALARVGGGASQRVASVVDAMLTLTSSGGSSLCDVPLYLSMFADVYLEQTELLNEKNSRVVSKIDLYQRFVLKALNIRWERLGIRVELVFKKEEQSTQLDRYKHIAAEEIFSGTPELEHVLASSKGNLLSDRETFELIEKDGLITGVVNGKPTFIHYSIAEFLAGWWLFEYFESHRSIPSSLYESNAHECLSFFDAFLVSSSMSHSNRLPLHEAVLAGGRPRERRLTALLARGRGGGGGGAGDVDARDAGGRTPLHLAAIAGLEAEASRLLDAGARPDATDRVLKWTPLRYADASMRAQRRGGAVDFVSHVDVIERLLRSSSGRTRDMPRLVADRELIEYAIKKDYPHVIRKVVNKLFSRIPGSRSGWHRHQLVYFAAKHESSKVLQVLRNHGFKINKIEKSEKISLHEAAQKGFVTLCQLLIEMGADVNARDERGNLPLHYAARSGRKVLCALLLGYGKGKGAADIDAKGHRNLTALHCAVDEGHRSGADAESDHEELCRFLLERGADANARSDNGNTALHFACFRGCARVTRLLIARGVRVDARDDDGISALHWAALRGHDAVCGILLESHARTDLMDVEGYTALHWAAVAARRDVAKLLLDHGADVNARSEVGTTALHKAGERGFAEFCEVLLDHGADADTKDDRLQTALHHASRTDLYDICETLIERRASLEEKDFKGRRPLHRAAKKGHDRICSLLLRHGAEVDALTLKGRSPLHIAAEEGFVSVCRLLLRHGADIDLTGGTRRHTPLHLAAIAGQTDAVVALLENGADFTKKDQDGHNVVHLLSQRGDEDVINFLLLYIASGTSTRSGCVFARTNDGHTALHVAAAAGHVATCRLLLRLGIDVNARDRSNKRALHYAVENQHFHLAQVLVKNGAIEKEA